MFCENCGKEIPENETVCPYCNGAAEEVTEEVTEEAIEDVAEETVEEPEFNPEELGVPVSSVVRGKRSTTRVIFGVVALLVAVAALVASLLKPILIIGSWKMNQTIPTGMEVDFQVESTMTFTNSGKLTLTDELLNWKEANYPEDQSKFVNEFTYTMEKGDLLLKQMPAEGEEAQQSEPVAMHCSVTPKMFSYWQGDSIPRQVYDYQRSGLFYPSMILWIVSGVFAVLGVLLLAIPGKKLVLTTYEELEDEDITEEADDLDEFLEEIYEEIEAGDEVVEAPAEELPEVTE